MSQQIIDCLLDNALIRKRQRCSYESSYSHENIKEWLESAVIDVDEKWEVVIPRYDGSNVHSAVSQWPDNKTSKSVQRWLKNQGCPDGKDLLEGACDPLAFFLSSSIETAVKTGTFEDLKHSQDCALQTLENLKPSEAAKLVFQNYINPQTRGPIFWSSTFGESSYNDFLFGNESMKAKITTAVHPESCVSFMPLYILNYLFDNDELSEQDLSGSTEESAQYSCHAVGLIFDRFRRRIILADPNGPLIPGFNMEFLKIPLTQRRIPTTKLSSFDMDQMRIQRKRKML